MIVETNRGTISVAAKPLDPYGPYYSAMSGSTAGQSATPEDVVGLTAFYGGVSMISMTGGTMPLEIIDTSAASGSQLVSGGRLAPMLKSAPNADMSGAHVWMFVITCLLTRGNAYLAKLRDASGQVAELYPLRPGEVTPWRGPDGQKLFRVRVYRGSTAMEGDFTEDAILHIPGPSLFDPLVGASPVEIMRNTLGTQLAQKEYQAKSYKDGMLIKGVLTTPEKNLNPDAVRRVKEDWRATYSGVGNSHDIAVTHSNITFQPVSLTPEDAQFIQTMKWGHTEIATMLNIPVSRLNGDGGSGMRYANMAQDDLFYAKQAVMPRVKLIEEALNRDRDLFGATSAWKPKFNNRDALRADELTRFQVYQIERNIGTQSQNTILAAEDRPTIGAAGDDFAPLNSGGGGVVDGGSGGSANA